MEIKSLVPENRQIVQSYGSGRFKVSQIEYQNSIIVLPSRTLFWSVDVLEDINLQNLSPILEEEPRIEILLIGCGKMMQLLPRDLAETCRQRGLAIDAMDTGAACRTFNLLLAEDRAVSAALIAVE